MTTKTVGRNEPCPCGSGKKYKKCCWEKDQTERAVLARAKAGADQERQQAALEALRESQALDAASNAVLNLLRAGKLEEAERAAHELLERYPEVPDGHERLGAVYEARGDRRQAAECYRKVIDLIRAHPGEFDPRYEQHLLAKLDRVTL